MSNLEQALAKYTRARDAVETHILQNKVVFDPHQQLVYAVIDAENQLRDEVAIANQGVEDGAYRVTVTPQTQTWGDIEEIDRLVSRGVLTQEQRNQIVKTQERPARISITAKKG